MKDAAYYRKKEQTYLKHYFLERYLETVAFHIGYTHHRFTYVDCFSGPWRAADEELADTSIRIALDKLNYVRDALAARQCYPAINAVFIEKDRKAFRALETALEQHRRAITTKALTGTFEANIPGIISEVGTAFTFFFIDPKGWTGFAMDNIAPILRHQPGEVMVNFMYDFVNRFINYPDEVNEQTLDHLFGTQKWRGIREANDRETASVDLYKEQLRATGDFTYVTSTRILKPLSDRAYFHLIYATRNAKGILKFRDVEKQTVKEQDAVRQAAQRENREERSGQAEIIFDAPTELSNTLQAERTRRLAEAHDRISELLKPGPMRYEQLQPHILEIPLVWNTDFNSMLLSARQAGTIAIDGMGSRDRTPKKGCTIRLER